MELLTVEVYMPAMMERFDIRLPAAFNCAVAAKLTAETLSGMSDGAYLPSKASSFAWEINGKLLDTTQSLEAQNVRNGSKLLLI